MKLNDVFEALDVEHCGLAGSSFVDVNLGAARFTNVNLAGAKLDDVNLSGLEIRNANLSHASIDEACVDGMRIRGILVTELLAVYNAQKAAGESAQAASKDS
jgi:uncharacterized protein YjbI with pentapeptide repeats